MQSGPLIWAGVDRRRSKGLVWAWKNASLVYEVVNAACREGRVKVAQRRQCGGRRMRDKMQCKLVDGVWTVQTEKEGGS